MRLKTISLLLLSASLAALPGCGGFGASPTAGEPVSLEKFAGGSKLTYVIELESDREMHFRGSTSQVHSTNLVELTLEGREDSLEVGLNRFEATMGAGSRQSLVIKLDSKEITGQVEGDSLASATKAADAELEALRRRLVAGRIAGMQLDEKAQRVRIERFTPPETDVLISPGMLDYVVLFLAPQEITRRTWTRTCYFPLVGDVSAQGELTYRVNEDDWQRRNEKWVWRVHVEGKLSADGMHTATSPESFPNAKSSKPTQQRLYLSDSEYRFSGELLYSRLSGQFNSGDVQVEFQQTAHVGADKAILTGSQTIRLKPVTADPPLPLPTLDRQLDKSAHEVVVLENATRPLILDAKKTRYRRETGIIGADWRVELDLTFPEGIAGALKSKDGETLYVLAPSGKLLRIGLHDFELQRSVDLKTKCQAIVRSGDYLVVCCPEVERLVVLDADLALQKVWKAAPGDSLRGCPTLPWVVVGDSERRFVRIVDIERGEIRYQLSGENLRRISVATEGRVRRPPPSNLACGGFSPDGQHLVVVGDTFHRLKSRDGALYYEEDGTTADCDGQTLGFTDDGRVAVRCTAPKTKPGPVLVAGQAVQLFRLAEFEVAPLTYATASTGALQFRGDELLVASETGMRLLSPAGRSRSSSSRRLSAWGEERHDMAAPVSELLAAVPVEAAFLCLGRTTSAYFSVGHGISSNLRRADGKFRLTPVEYEVEELDLAAEVDPQLSQYPTLKLPERISALFGRAIGRVAWSPSGREFFLLLQDGSVLRIDANARRCTHRLRIMNERYRKQEVLLRMSACQAGLVVSDSGGGRQYVLDFGSLACRGRIDLQFGSPFVGKTTDPTGVAVSRDRQSYYLLNLQQNTFRRIFPEDIAGIDDSVLQELPKELDDIGTKPGDPIAFDSEGKHLLLELNHLRCVFRTEDSWSFGHVLNLRKRYYDSLLPNNSMVLKGSKQNPGACYFDWTRPDGDQNVHMLPKAGQYPCLGCDAKGERFYLSNQPLRTIQVCNAGGELIGEHPEAYTGKYGEGVYQMFSHPARQDMLMQLFSEQAIGWFTPEK